MRVCSRESAVDFAFLPRSGPASGAANCQCVFNLSLHDCIMQPGHAINWSIVIVLDKYGTAQPVGRNWSP
jgi:hypothetical protein